MSQIINFFNPLDEIDSERGLRGQVELSELKVHLRVVQRNGRRCITLVNEVNSLAFSKGITSLEEIPSDWELKKLLQTFKEKFACGGFLNEIGIHLTGDKRADVKKYLIDKGMVKEEQVVVHGY